LTFEQLQHLLRASAEIVGDNQFIVIGSQSILGKFPHAPASLLWSTEVDLISKNKPRMTEKLNSIGENSEFHDTFGVYADPVSEKTAVLAKGWKGRLVNVTASSVAGEIITGLCLDPHDLLVAKVAAGREKDMEYVQTMIEHRMVDRDRVLMLAATVPNPVVDMDRSRRIVARIERAYSTVSEHQLTHINVANGKYLGRIVGVSDSVVQQMTTSDDIIFHQTNQIDQVPALGDLCTVQYQGGHARVLTHSHAREPALQLDLAEPTASGAQSAIGAKEFAASREEIERFIHDHGYVAEEANTERGEYVGPILKTTAHHLVQHLGRQQVAMHEMERVPPLVVNQPVHLRYHDGAAQLLTKSQGQEQER
jgi:hypothetical protein